MSNTNDSKYYADKLISYVERKKKEKNEQLKQSEYFSKAFTTINNIISTAVSESGLNDFIELVEKTSSIKLSNIPYQTSDPFEMQVQFPNANCGSIKVVFFEPKISVTSVNSDILRSHIQITQVSEFTSNTSRYINNSSTPYTQALNEQYTLYYDKSEEKWLLGILDRSKNNRNPENRELLTTDSIMRIFYSAFNPLLK